MPLLDEPIILDVTLRFAGEVRQWTISKWSMGWSCKYADKGRVIVGGCRTPELMLAKKRQFEAEIAAARADGWA